MVSARTGSLWVGESNPPCARSPRLSDSRPNVDPKTGSGSSGGGQQVVPADVKPLNQEIERALAPLIVDPQKRSTVVMELTQVVERASHYSGPLPPPEYCEAL